MTQLRKTMLDELQRRNYAQTTVNGYLKVVAAFAKYFNRPPNQLGPEHIRAYQAYLFQEKKLNARTVNHHTAALRFFFCKTLRRAYLLEEAPYPKTPRRLLPVGSERPPAPQSWGAVVSEGISAKSSAGARSGTTVSKLKDVGISSSV